MEGDQASSKLAQANSIPKELPRVSLTLRLGMARVSIKDSIDVGGQYWPAKPPGCCITMSLQRAKNKNVFNKKYNIIIVFGVFSFWGSFLMKL